VSENKGKGHLGAMWDERYATQGWSQLPDEALVEMAKGLNPGWALDLGCGTGRNSLWLAKQGWEVTGVDASQVGLKILTEQAASDGLHLMTEQVDLLAFQPTPEFYDLVLIANIHLAPKERESLFDRAATAVRPGGHLYIVGHHVDVLGKFGPPSRDHLYEESLFRDRFAGFSIQTLERRETLSDINETADVSMLFWAQKDQPAAGATL